MICLCDCTKNRKKKKIYKKRKLKVSLAVMYRMYFLNLIIAHLNMHDFE